MKKILCILLAVMMMFSSVAVIGASAADGYAAKNPITQSFNSYDEFVALNGDKKIYGYTYDFLYNSTGLVDWTKLGIQNQMNGISVPAMASDITTAKGNINSYLKRIVYNFFISDKLYTEEYAVDLINFFGKLVYPDFQEVTTAFDGDTTPNTDDFYKIVADKSKLGDIIQENWCNAGVNFKPFLTAVGVNLNDIVDRDFANGRRVAKALVQGIVSSFISHGPIEYATRLIYTFANGYSSVLYDATTSLFRLKISEGKPVKTNGVVTGRTLYGEEELKSMEGLLTYMFDGVINYDFFTFPTKRIVVSENEAEQLLFLMMYFAINYRYKDNASFVNGISSKINSFFLQGGRYSSVGGYSYEEIQSVMDNISKMIDVIFKGDITTESAAMINGLGQENMDELPNDILTNLKSWLSKLMRKIADYFDYLLKLFTGEIKYGDSLFD